MKSARSDEDLEAICDVLARLAKASQAEAILVLLEGPSGWDHLKRVCSEHKLIAVAETQEQVRRAGELGIKSILFEMADIPVYDKISQALLKAVALELLQPGARVVAAYSGFDADSVDSISLIDLADHLGRLTVRDLRQLETRVPLETLQTVVNLALEIGREGREGKPVGTLFVVGDTARVRRSCRAAGFDPVKGYSRKERNLKSARVREAIKEIAQMDGAILVGSDGTVEAAAQYIDAPAANITLSKGLGARHWAAASISRTAKAVAVTVSESSGTVRIFQNGEVVLRIEPFRRPMKWKDFEYEPPPASE